MDKRFVAIIAVIVLAFVGVVVFNRNHASAPGGSSGNASQATNHVKGGNAKKVTLVEYGDFQCPVCGAYEPVLQQVYTKYQADIQFQFRNFPLQQVHQNALAGSRAAEAASLQGKFWEMHDQLYANQQTWSTATTPQTYFEAYAQALSLNMDQYRKDFASEKVNNVVNADIAAGTALKVTGTPGLFLDGKALNLSELVDADNRPQADKFSKLLDAAIAAKK